MKHIPLTQGQFAIVDDADFEWLSKWKWTAQRSKWGYYAFRRQAEEEAAVAYERASRQYFGEFHRDTHGVTT
jgi:hypothetical protein